MNILVLCTGNSARSILLESLLHHWSDGRLRAYSAGSNPAGAVHPGALALLRREGFQTDSLRSKSWDEFAGDDAPKIDVVITVCGNAANEVCPVWPGTPVTTHWGVEDPAAAPTAVQDDAFNAAFEILGRRAKAAIDLGIESVDKRKLKDVLDEIGTIA